MPTDPVDPKTTPAPQPTMKDLSYPDIENADLGGMTLNDLDPESDQEPDSRLDPAAPEGPAEGADIG